MSTLRGYPHQYYYSRIDKSNVDEVYNGAQERLSRTIYINPKMGLNYELKVVDPYPLPIFGGAKDTWRICLEIDSH